MKTQYGPITNQERESIRESIRKRSSVQTEQRDTAQPKDRSTKKQWEDLANEALRDAGYWKREARKAQAHAERLAEALRDIRDAAYDPWKVAEVTSDTVAVSKLSGRIYSVANAALAAWENQ